MKLALTTVPIAFTMKVHQPPSPSVLPVKMASNSILRTNVNPITHHTVDGENFTTAGPELVKENVLGGQFSSGDSASTSQFVATIKST